MNSARILIIEDDPDTARLHQLNLTEVGYQVVLTHSGVTGLIAAREQHFDLVLLDLGLPDFDGSQIIQRLHGKSKVPVIVVSARDHLTERVRLLDLGASDYLVKPFDSSELIARINTKLRRSTRQTLEVGALSINPECWEVTWQGEAVRLTPLETKVLSTLMVHGGNVLSVEQIGQLVWPEEELVKAHLVRTYLSSIRQKLWDVGGYRVIRTVRGVGYGIWT